MRRLRMRGEVLQQWQREAQHGERVSTERWKSSYLRAPKACHPLRPWPAGVVTGSISGALGWPPPLPPKTCNCVCNRSPRCPTSFLRAGVTQLRSRRCDCAEDRSRLLYGVALMRVVRRRKQPRMQHACRWAVHAVTGPRFCGF